MSEETQTASETQSEATPPVKEAEVKLKEMSRKAKERKTATVSRSVSTRSPKNTGSNLRLVLIGGLGVGVLGILYLMLSDKHEARGQGPKERNEVPTPNENPEKQRNEKPISPKKDPPKINKTEFEINSF